MLNKKRVLRHVPLALSRGPNSNFSDFRVKSVIGASTSSNLSVHADHQQKSLKEIDRYYNIYTSITIVHIHLSLSLKHSKVYKENSKVPNQKRRKKMKICHRHLLFATTLLSLALFTVVYMMLPSNLTKFIIDTKPSYSVSLHHLRTKVSGENDHLLAVRHTSHSNATVTVTNFSTLTQTPAWILNTKKEKKKKILDAC